jgi:hypothetical protein
VGFEPTVRLRAQRFSRPPRSTTPAPLHQIVGPEISGAGMVRRCHTAQVSSCQPRGAAPQRRAGPAISLRLTASDIAPAPSARMDEAAALVLNRGSHAEPSRPKITISRAMSRLIGRAFTAVLAADHVGSDLRRSGECMTQQIGKEPQSFALPSTFIVEHQAPSRPTPQGC